MDIMKTYWKLIEDLGNYLAIHWSKMSVGDKYFTKIKAPRIIRFTEHHSKKKRSQVRLETYYIIKKQ